MRKRVSAESQAFEEVRRDGLTLFENVGRSFDESDVVSNGLLNIGEGEKGDVVGVDVLWRRMRGKADQFEFTTRWDIFEGRNSQAPCGSCLSTQHR